MEDIGELPYTEFIKKLMDPEKIFDKPEPLKGIRVLDMTYVVLGPAAVDYLAEFGAEVIFFEDRDGDTMRYVTPFAYFYKNMSPGLQEQNHNKYWVGMDVRHPKAKELFLELVKKSDVVVENLAPGRMAEWGLSYRELKEINPKLIYLSLSGFGHWGPWAGRTSYDAIAQSQGGLSSITGYPERGPIKSGVWIADWIGGLMGAIAVMAALNYREKTGEGQFIDYLQTENVIRWLDWTWLYVFKTGKDRERAGNRDLAICPSDMFTCKDGWIAIAAFKEEEFYGLCKAMDRLDLFEKYKDPLERLKEENSIEILNAIAEWAKTKTVKEIDDLGAKYGFASSPILDVQDAYYSEHYRERKAIFEYEDPLYGEMVEPCYPPRMSETPSRIKWGAKPIGFDNEYVFTKILGLTIEEVRKLEEEGVLFKWNEEKPMTCPPPDWDGKRGKFFL
ncbi:CoA transferase [Archaeoglobales archaeon]|nr:MAG: CoA transferase [Archaeoglobales archaeon]